MISKKQLEVVEKIIECTNTELITEGKTRKFTYSAITGVILSILSVLENKTANTIIMPNEKAIFNGLSAFLVASVLTTRNDISKMKKTLVYVAAPILAASTAYSLLKIRGLQIDESISEAKEKKKSIVDDIKKIVVYLAKSVIVHIIAYYISKLVMHVIEKTVEPKLKNMLNKLYQPSAIYSNFTSHYITLVEFIISYVVSLCIMFVIMLKYINAYRIKKNMQTINFENIQRELNKEELIIVYSIFNLFKESFDTISLNNSEITEASTSTLLNISEAACRKLLHMFVIDKITTDEKVEKIEIKYSDEELFAASKNTTKQRNTEMICMYYAGVVHSVTNSIDGFDATELSNKLKDKIEYISQSCKKLFSVKLDDIVRNIYIYRTPYSQKNELTAAYITNTNDIFIFAHIIDDSDYIVKLISGAIAHEISHRILNHNYVIFNFIKRLVSSVKLPDVSTTVFFAAALHMLIVYNLRQTEYEADALAYDIVGSDIIELMHSIKMSSKTRIISGDHGDINTRYQILVDYYKRRMTSSN
jgi:hypothetical protein